MSYELILNVFVVIMTIAGLTLSLFWYISSRRREWIYVIAFLLGNLLSNFYWTAYILIMGDYPDISMFMAYLGWNIGCIPFVLLARYIQVPEERRYFSPLLLVPVVLNVAQFIIYIPFGGILNNVWQGVWCTLIACISLQSILWHRKNPAADRRMLPISVLLFLFVILEYTMWTSSCFDWPSEWLHPYNYASPICFSLNIFLPLTLRRATGGGQNEAENSGDRFSAVLKGAYLFVIAACCIGGFMLAVWMRNTIDAGIPAEDVSSLYRMIAVILFIVAWVIVAFSIAIVFVAYSMQKSAESAELRLAKTAAEQASAAKSDFLASMSHEIRTPINAILGMNEIILRESLKARDFLPKERERVRGVFGDICTYAGNIESAGNSLLSIINDILDFARIESGRLEITEREYKLSSVLNDVSNMISFKAQAKNLTFKVDVDETIPDGLLGDEVRVRQIITNLLNNAVKYTDKGSIHLILTREETEAPRAGESLKLKVAVRDTGIGIRPEDQEKLFRRFERLDLRRNNSVEGTGLGLAITQSLLNRMGGTIAVESVYGEGSTFSVVIPQQVVSCEPVGNFREKYEHSILEAKAREESFRAPEAHILIVDDTRMNITVAIGLLKNTEIEIDAAVSGAESIELAGHIRYDVILMDQRMPVMDGTEAMRRIRAIPDGVNADTPVICLTADAVSGARERYLAEGFTDYLTKPVDGKSLERMLMKYLPAEKILSAEAAPETGAEAAPAPEAETVPAGTDRYAPLEEAGVDAASGLFRCQGDSAFFDSLLLEYLRGRDEKTQALQTALDSADWKNYAVHVHALKSTSRMLGAGALADAAAALEAAANNADGETVLQGHGPLLEKYSAVTDAIRSVLGPEAAADAGAEEEILEFFPGE